MKSRRRIEYSLIVGWVFFCAYTFYEARHPGFVDISRWSYPWGNAAITCLVLGALIAAFYAILRAPSTIWRNVGVALYVLLLLTLTQILSITDQPGHFYVVGRFAIVALVAVAVWAAIEWWKSYVYAA